MAAEYFFERGHKVKVITASSSSPSEPQITPYAILRRPNLALLLNEIRLADRIIESNPCLSYSWPIHLAALLGLRSVPNRHLLVIHTPIATPDGKIRPRDKIKRMVAHRSNSYAVSEYLSRELDLDGRVLWNPYDPSLFNNEGDSRERTSDLLFVGRLTRAKGCEIAIRALALIHTSVISSRSKPHLTVVGTGEQEPFLRALCTQLNLEDKVTFLGKRSGKEVGDLMRMHRAILMPSLSCPAEAFGIVAIEALACGCLPIVSCSGGLPEAVNGCGIIVPEDSPKELARAIALILDDYQSRANLLAHTSAKLSKHTPDQVFGQYDFAFGRTVPNDRRVTNR